MGLICSSLVTSSSPQRSSSSPSAVESWTESELRTELMLRLLESSNMTRSNIILANFTTLLSSPSVSMLTFLILITSLKVKGGRSQS